MLLPGHDGKTGALSVTSGQQQRVLDRPYAAARVTRPGRVENRPTTEEEVRRTFGPALAAQPGRPVSFLLYFLVGTDDFTPESEQVVGRILAEVASRPAPEIVVIGHTDSVGSVPYNDALSLKRAERVRDELVKIGVPAERISIAGRGKRDPMVPTDDDVPESRNRRVEISVR